MHSKPLEIHSEPLKLKQKIIKLNPTFLTKNLETSINRGIFAIDNFINNSLKTKT